MLDRIGDTSTLLFFENSPRKMALHSLIIFCLCFLIFHETTALPTPAQLVITTAPGVRRNFTDQFQLDWGLQGEHPDVVGFEIVAQEVGSGQTYTYPVACARCRYYRVGAGALHPGSYLWHVIALSADGHRVQSQNSGSFIVVQGGNWGFIPPPEVLYPISGQNFRYPHEVRFNWRITASRNDVLRYDILVTSSNGNTYTGSVACELCNVFNMPHLPIGHYTWTVTAIGHNGARVQSLTGGHFSIVRDEELLLWHGGA